MGTNRLANVGENTSAMVSDTLVEWDDYECWSREMVREVKPRGTNRKD
jgi:hypothetical protein